MLKHGTLLKVSFDKTNFWRTFDPEIDTDDGIEDAVGALDADETVTFIEGIPSDPHGMCKVLATKHGLIWVNSEDLEEV